MEKKLDIEELNICDLHTYEWTTKNFLAKKTEQFYENIRIHDCNVYNLESY